MSTAPSLQENLLLAALPAEVKARLSPHLELVPLPLGKILAAPGEFVRYAYFPVDAIVSLLTTVQSGASAEIAVVGGEGIIGIALFMGGESAAREAVVRSAGYAFRIAAHWLVEEFNRHGDLMVLLLRYTQFLITQIAQTAVCNRHHSIDQQLCRTLLMSLDRLPGNRVSMTQELIANLLGVRREGVTDAAGKLHKAGLIDYRRGQITVLDRPALEKFACECYAVVKREGERLMAWGPSMSPPTQAPRPRAL